MYKKVNVAMLPTNEKAKAGQLVINKEVSNELFIAWIDAQRSLGYHLYILSDEEIKEGDWFYFTNDNGENYYIHQCVKSSLNSILKNKSAKKIIATNDKSLTIDIIPSGFKSGVGALSHKQNINLPKIPQSFIEHFISEYNKGNIITEVMVEYENKQKTINYHKDLWVDDWVLKINPDNTINIKPIKINKYEDLYKAIDKIKEGHKGSAINFIERFINTQKN